MLDFELILQNSRILLRPLIMADIKGFEELTTDKHMWIYFTNDLSDKSVLHEWVDEALSLKEMKLRLPFTIIDKKSGGLIGSTSFGNISNRDKRIEIGWTWLSKNYWGTGINDEVKFLMIQYCFESLEFERVEFKTDVVNLPARNALTRINMTEEGILRSHTLMTNNRRRDTIYYSVLKPEWPEIKTKNNWEV